MPNPVTIGHDAEVFVSVNGHITSAIGLVGGTKEAPRPVNSGALQEDNVLAELNINPAVTSDYFIGNTREVLSQLMEILPAGYDINVQSSHTYDKQHLISYGAKATEFGCDPDYNCWTLDQNETPNPYTCLRTAGGHVHVGFGDECVPTATTRVEVARMCDYLLGLPSVLLDPDVDRRSMYGQAGAYREKDYGVEYRTLSNFWLKDDVLMRWVFNQAKRAILERNTIGNLRAVLPAAELQRIINHSDAASAAEYVGKLGLEMP